MTEEHKISELKSLLMRAVIIRNDAIIERNPSYARKIVDRQLQWQIDREKVRGIIIEHLKYHNLEHEAENVETFIFRN